MNQMVRKDETNCIPKTVNQVINEYLNVMEGRLPNLLESFYIFGSVSIGAFQEGMSDIDFVAVVKRKLSETDVAQLKDVHESMKRTFPKTGLDGMYVLREDLEGINEGGPSCPYFNEGTLQGYRTFDRNWIDSFQLKTYGIVIKGLPIETYNLSIDWETLKSNLIHNVNTYWLNWKNGCEKVTSLSFIGSFVSGSMIEWGVLGVTRLYYSLREEDITSKMGAGEYALHHVPEKYHRILHEAMRLRQGNKPSYYRSVFKRRRDMLDYMAYMMRECNAFQ
ncbi:DUF4111 domain-containing protein [Fictibacillus nanhaiensis]|uniref:aminoglycoside adenylyltransferase domain-containing protein n=1 Tax=Fictibacillus nanhaiensis TaxID=742169 RepID=UPI001C9760F6|nr:aminoglycoside adenylyltransferase domain-containing protein [Fictibacillus nanhaiensis]MBY6036638.1 DUF4111 domain-containing protein [Fictibacillus nanhaiensis]